MPVDPGRRFITSRLQLAELLREQDKAAPPIQSHTQGLAHLLRAGLSGYMQGADKRERAAAYQTMRDALLRGDTQSVQARPSPGFVGPMPMETTMAEQNAAKALSGLGSEYGDVMSQDLAMQAMARRRELADAERAREDGLIDFEQKLKMKQKYPTAGATPSNIAEWTEYQRMTPEEKEEYLLMKRANPYLNLGGAMVQPSTTQAGVARGGFEVTPKPEQMPGFKGEQEAAVQRAKAGVEKQTNAPKARSALLDFERKTETVTGTIDKAITLAEQSATATGYGNLLLSGLPDTDARALNNYLDTIKANIGFDALQKMRDNSPTGGALGQVSEMENRLLQAVQGALDPMQSEQLVENLKRIRELYPQVLAEKRAAFEADYGGESSRSPGNTVDEWEPIQ